jgi:hypothetical protein
MEPATRVALEGSIKKWADIVAGTGYDGMSGNCPLCQYAHGWWDDENDDAELDECHACPVYQRTGATDCGDTPYTDWVNHLRIRHNLRMWFGDDTKRTVQCDECRILAQQELDFLISLREPESGDE